MDKEFFLNSGSPPPLHFEQPPMPSWQSHSSDFLFEPSWDNSTDHYSNFESALSSIVSSPAASNSTISQDNFVIHELIGKLTTTGNSGEISLHSHPITDHFGNENLPNWRNSMLMNPNLVSADPGFAERAAKFSCLGSRSFNGRVSQLPYRSNSFIGSGKLSRVLSSPLLKAYESSMGVLENKNLAQTHMKFASSNEGSSVSEQIPSGDIGLKTPSDSNSRKRKAVSKEKSKEIVKILFQEAEAEDDPKRSKSSEGHGREKPSVKKEEETKSGDEGQKQDNPKPPEPPKDYIHVRARRGQATDSHSLAERVRREKISERMKLLQDLVPNCNKVIGKALMLDEIINYVQSLQHQVEFLSMKLASVDFSMDSFLVKDEFQPIGSLTHPIYPKVHSNFSNGTVTQCSVDPMNTTIFQNNSMQVTPIDELGQCLPQFPLCEDDLQSIFQVGFAQNLEL